MARNLKAVIDTNLFISGLFAKDSLSAQLQDLWINQDFDLVTSIEFIKEISRVLNYPRIKEHFKPKDKTIKRFFRLIFRKAIISDHVAEVLQLHNQQDLLHQVFQITLHQVIHGHGIHIRESLIFTNHSPDKCVGAGSSTRVNGPTG